MEQYIIKGGNPLVGEVEIGGAKNAALAILAAAIMTDETVTIDNLPDVNDINVLLEAISGIGAEVDRIDRHTVRINGSNIENFDIEYDYIKKIRASYYLLGALLGKYKRAEVALPGGCNIGSRPIDQHLKGFRALGAYVDIEHGKIIAEAERLIGKHIYFDVVSVGATINVMMAASMAEGLTILENVAKEPHVVDVANFLNSMGANIRGAGTDVIKIRGVSRLHKTDYSIIPDQIEAGTFMFAAHIPRRRRTDGGAKSAGGASGADCGRVAGAGKRAGLRRGTEKPEADAHRRSAGRAGEPDGAAVRRQGGEEPRSLSGAGRTCARGHLYHQRRQIPPDQDGRNRAAEQPPADAGGNRAVSPVADGRNRARKPRRDRDAGQRAASGRHGQPDHHRRGARPIDGGGRNRQAALSAVSPGEPDLQPRARPGVRAGCARAGRHAAQKCLLNRAAACHLER